MLIASASDGRANDGRASSNSSSDTSSSSAKDDARASSGQPCRPASDPVSRSPPAWGRDSSSASEERRAFSHVTDTTLSHQLLASCLTTSPYACCRLEFLAPCLTATARGKKKEKRARLQAMEGRLARIEEALLLLT